MNRKGVIEIKKFLILILLILSAMCVSTKEDTRPPVVEEPYICPDCNVILISIDTLRADHLGSYGYLKDTSPNIDRFASESTLFENAIVQASWTAPSHMSIMTSLYPAVHKVQRVPGSPETPRLDDSVVTLAQVLKADGYRTASFNAGGYVSEEFGFDRGFDVYTLPSRDNMEITTNAATNWLSENREQKFFLFLHTYAVHAPYAPPARYKYKFFPYYNESTDRKKGMFMRMSPREGSGGEVKNDYIQKLIAFYDGDINYVDHELNRLLDTLDYLNLSNNTIVIFTSDHGEQFMEYGLIGHGLVAYQVLIHVPLIIRFPGITGSRIENLAQSIDIMPTILDSLDITGPSNLQGVTLLPLIVEGKNVNAYAYSEGTGNGRIKVIIDENAKWKYIYNVEDKHEELYDLEDGPLEKNNLIRKRPEIAEKLREELFRWMEENERLAKDYSTSEVELENETKEALRALGYLT